MWETGHEAVVGTAEGGGEEVVDVGLWFQGGRDEEVLVR